MSDETESYRRSLINFSQFVINRETDDVRSDFFKSLVESGFFYSQNGIKSIEELNTLLNEKFEIQVSTEKQLENALQKLIEEKRILKKGEKFYLSEEKRNTIKIDIDYKNNLLLEIENIYLNIIKNLSPELTKENIDILKNNFFEFLSAYFIFNSELLSVTLIGTSSKEDFTIELNTLIEKCILMLKDKKIIDIQKKAIKNFFTLKNQIIADFFSNTFLNFIFFEMMSLDPDLSKLEMIEISKYELFIDTNVIMDLLFSNRPRCQITKELVKLSNKMGIKLLYTAYTKSEFMDILKNSERQYKNLSSKIKNNAISKISYLDDIIDAFFFERRTNPSFSFEGFCIKFERGFEKILSDLNIMIFDRDISNFEKSSDIYIFNRNVLGCAKKWNIYKNEKVVLHDAISLLLISELRKLESDSLLGPKKWFLTNDSSLYCVSQNIKKEKEHPLSIRGDILLDILYLFMPVKMKNEFNNVSMAFLDFCDKSLSMTLPKIELNKLQYIAGPWMNYESITPHTIAEVLSKKFVKEYINKTQIAIESGMEPEPVQPILDKAINEILEDKNKTINLRIKEINELKQDVSELKEKYVNIENKLQNENLTLKNNNIKIKNEIKINRLIMIILIIILFILLDIFYPEYQQFLIQLQIAVIVGTPGIYFLYKWINKKTEFL